MAPLSGRRLRRLAGFGGTTSDTGATALHFRARRRGHLRYDLRGEALQLGGEILVLLLQTRQLFFLRVDLLIEAFSRRSPFGFGLLVLLDCFYL